MEVTEDLIAATVGAIMTPGLVSEAADPVGERASPARGPRDRDLRSRILVVVGALAVVASGTAVGLGLNGNGPHSTRWLNGQVVVVTAEYTIALTRPDGAHLVSQSVFGTFALEEGQTLAAAADGRYLVSNSGELISVNGGALGRADQAVRLAHGDSTAFPYPFADGDRALVVVSEGEFSPVSSAISVRRMTDGRTIALGDGDDAAGDPQALGAFVAVPELPQPPASPSSVGEADTEVVLRDAGRPALVLATAAQLNIDVNQNPATPVNLSVFPDPTGNMVAVAVSSTASFDANAGLVILDRNGHLLSRLPAGDGPAANSRPAWSPNAKYLAYYTSATKGPTIGVMSLNGHVHTRLSPERNASIAYCLWSTDGSAILCPTDNGTGIGDGSHWIVGEATSGALVQVPAAGVPVAWISSRLSTASPAVTTAHPPTTGLTKTPARPSSPAEVVTLRGSGIGNVPFGTTESATIAGIDQLLGPPNQTIPQSQQDNCGIDATIEWPTLTVYFSTGRFVGYSAAAANSRSLPDRKEATEKGLQVGDSLPRAEQLYGSSLTTSLEQGGAWFATTLGGTLDGYLSSEPNQTEPTPEIVSIEAGDLGCAAVAP